MRRCVLLAALCILLVSSQSSAQEKPGLLRRLKGEPGFDGRVVKDVVYCEGPKAEEAKHKLDLYIPKDAKNAPVLIWIHGGGWRMGDRDDILGLYPNVGRTFAREGFVTAVISYRLSPQFKHPAHIQDCARAFAWVHAHVAEHGGDPQRIFISGQSAGGHLAALLALDGKHLKALGLSPDHIKGVLAISGVYNLAESIKGVDQFLMEPAFGEDASKWPAASPLTYVTGKHPPFLVTYADRDPFILHRQAKLLHDALKAKGTDSQLEPIRGRSHISEVINIGKPDDPLTAAMLRFMKEKMR